MSQSLKEFYISGHGESRSVMTPVKATQLYACTDSNLSLDAIQLTVGISVILCQSLNISHVRSGEER